MAPPLPHGTEVLTRAERYSGERRLAPGTVGRVVRARDGGYDVHVVGVGELWYAGDELDARKTFVIGIALCFGISLDILPQLYAETPPWLRPLFDSSLTFATVIAVVLTQLLRYGEKPEAAPAAEADKPEADRARPEPE